MLGGVTASENWIASRAYEFLFAKSAKLKIDEFRLKFHSTVHNCLTYNEFSSRCGSVYFRQAEEPVCVLPQRIYMVRMQAWSTHKVQIRGVKLGEGN